MYFGYSMWNSVKERKAKMQELTAKENQTNAQTTMEQHSNDSIDKYDGTGTGLSKGTMASNDPWEPLPNTQPVAQQAFNSDAGYQNYDNQDNYNGYDDTSAVRGVGAGAEFPDTQEKTEGGGSQLWFEKPKQNDPWQSYE